MLPTKTKKFIINNSEYEDNHPKDQANWLSHFLFCWQLHTFFKIWKDKNTYDEFTVPVKKHDSQRLGDKLAKIWNQEKLSKHPSLVKALTKHFGLECTLSGLFFCTADVSSTFLQPIYLGKLLGYFLQETSINKKQAYVYGLIIVVSILIRVLSFQFFMMETYCTGLKMRTACCSLVYRKILTSKASTVLKNTSGQLLNLLSNDTDKFEYVLCYIHLMWICILKIGITIFLLFTWSGLKGIVGVVTFAFFFILQYFFFKIATTRHKQVLKERDNRIGMMSDIIFRIQAIKMYVWETPFAQLVKAVRRVELNYASKLNYLSNENKTVGSYIHKISIYIFILLLTTTSTPLDPKVIFMTINLYNLLKTSVGDSILAISLIAEIKVSSKRIQNFLVLDEEINQTDEIQSNYKISFANITAKWDLSHKSTLNNINFELHSGEMVGIVGATGSGKSTLLQTILQELTIVSGNLSLGGSISYAPQSPWVFPATVRENIIFGEKFDENTYRKILRICALEHDVSRFPHGDNTLVGERGILLSGGQKARVSLARAIYKNADIYLLDDPLAAVDASVAHQIFTQCVLKYLRDKSVILVTHQLKFLKSMDRVYVLEDGKVKSCGKYQTIEAIVENSIENKHEKTQEHFPETTIEKCNMQSEIKEDIGNGGSNTFRAYLFAGNNKLLVYLQFALFISTQIFVNGSDIFLSQWINLRQGPSDFNSKLLSLFTDMNFFYLYTGLVLIMVILYHLSSFTFIKCSKQSSMGLHDLLCGQILHGSMKFFNDHASGRIVNRISRDMAIVDQNFPKSLYQTTRQVCALVGAFCVVVIINYYIVIPTVLLCVLFYYYLRAFQPVLTRLKKIAVTRKSPTFTHLSATLEGLTTIKALNAQQHSLSKFDCHQNFYNSIGYLHQALHNTYAFWIEVTSMLYISMVIFGIILYGKGKLVGNVGLSLTETLIMIGLVQLTMKLYGEVDLQMTSVERVSEYGDLISEEDQGTFIPPQSWPTNGQITFQSVSMRYSLKKPYILKDVNVKIQAGEKVGVVGRTGAGKSSLVSALFRLYDFEGTIWIDSVNTKLVPLSTLRSTITIIPQDPVLFAGTIRSNLDPFEKYTDSQLWCSLEEVKLKTIVSNLPSGLNTPVLDNGSNFSVGQRQMLCLVRAVLKKSTILVLDEATAFVDLETDKLIQTTVQERFKTSTVLKIAHRLETVMDSDKILVMEDGRVVEFGATGQLIENSDGYFYKYVYGN